MNQITPEVLEKVAKLLGWEELKDLNLPSSEEYPNGAVVFRHWQSWQNCGLLGVNSIEYSDGDLLLAILNKWAEMGKAGYLYALTVEAGVAAARKRPPQFLEAVLLSFNQVDFI